MPILPITSNHALDVRIYSSNRLVRRNLPSSAIGGDVTWTRDRKSGMAQFSLPTSMGVSSEVSKAIKEGDCVEFWWNGSRKYRGYITGRAHSEGNPSKLTLTGMGAMYFACKQACKGNLAFPSYADGADVALALRAFALSNLQSAMLPDGSGPLFSAILALPIGTNMTSITARYTIASDVLDEIDKQSGNLAIIGCDVDPVTQGNRLYVAPIASLLTPTHTLSVPGLGVSVISADENTTDIVNQLIVSGGTPRFPNLLHNGSFELPLEYGDVAGSLILNGGFEKQPTSGGGGGSSENIGAQNWSLSGGAIVANTTSEPSGNGVQANPYSGSDFLDLSAAGAKATQTGDTAMTAGGNYTLSVYTARKIAAQSALSAHIDLKLYSGANGTGSLLQTTTLNITPADDQYGYNYIHLVAPAGVGSFTTDVVLDSITQYTFPDGVVKQGGITVDEVDLYNSDQTYEDGWDLVPQSSTSVVNAFNWCDPDVAPLLGAGSYSLYANVTAVDEDGYAVQVTPPTGTFFKAQAASQIYFSAWVKSPAGDPAPFPPNVRLQIDWYDDGNHQLPKEDGAFPNVQIQQATAAASDGRIDTWLYCFEHAVVPASATGGRAFLAIRSSGALLVDCMSVQDVAAPTTQQTGFYLADGNFEVQIECDNPDLLAVYQAQFATQNPGAAIPSVTPFVNSKNVWGPRGDKYSNENIIDYPGALAVACNNFIGSAVTQFQPKIEAVDNTEDFLPGDSINLIGADGPSLTGQQVLTVEKLNCTYTAAGLFKQSTEIQKEQRDDITIISKLIDKNQRMYGPGYADGGTDSGGYSDATGGSSSVSTAPIIPSVALVGDVNGTNKVFGMPDEEFTSFDLHMDLLDIFEGNDYTYDPVAQQVTCLVAPRYWITADLYP